MIRNIRHGLACVSLLVALQVFPPLSLFAEDTQTWTAEQKEQFLRTAKIVMKYPAPKGITGTLRVTLSDGTTSHDASVQRVNQELRVFQPDSGPPELNFHDDYKFNIAAWKLAQLLGIDDMIPPSVERKYDGQTAAFTWWIDDVLMDEGERMTKKMNPPNQDGWNREMNVLVVFDQLIYNVDRNIGNMVIDKGWHLWMIDHTRSFRLTKTLKEPNRLTFVDRNLLDKMKALDEPGLVKALRPYVDKGEIQGLLARRDAIVKIFDTKGSRFIYERPARH